MSLVGFNLLVHSFCALSTLRCSGLRTASTAAKPCQGDSLEFYLVIGSIYTDKRGIVVLATLFNENLAPLRTLFLNIHSKDTIATKDELKPFSTFSSRMAALDFIVCDESDMFVMNNNSNMAKNLASRRKANIDSDEVVAADQDIENEPKVSNQD
ncbi:GDP-fucose protein O-fucosyltransferase [Tanacetum coccineum]|uniref:O-fucosyltransferase family protein n=1 Tax=Tanacetum coccineum TaxID=301880 RepID=A0ABQ5CPR7_9ASTR